VVIAPVNCPATVKVTSVTKAVGSNGSSIAPVSVDRKFVQYYEWRLQRDSDQSNISLGRLSPWHTPCSLLSQAVVLLASKLTPLTLPVT
ncbi:MAG TPA: hypothetical protein VMM27_15400, partial [Casimicrobiaceae bacterium]|nr:hypothetical protein [Casimicrobiaceae bacterium]